MIRRAMSLAMIISGILITISGLGVLMPTASAYAQSVPQPTPRPALGPDEQGKKSDTTVDMAHITGTVIDRATGAPVPYAQVRVGAMSVSADANGNYDLWIEPGTYLVATVSSDSTPQPEAQVALPAGELVIQHLSWIAPAPIATAVPLAAPAPALAAEPAAPHTAALKTEGAMPTSLPHTAGNPLFLVGGWFWVSLGIALIMGGMMIASRADALHAPARALARYATRQPDATVSADAAAFLAALLTSEVRANTLRDDELLHALLDRDIQRRHIAQDVLLELLQQPVVA